MAVWRTENALVTWGQETTWGTMVTPNQRFGIHDTATAPDPSIEWTPFFGVSSGRSRQTILRGKWSLRGGVPDIRAQSGAGLAALLGQAWGRVEGGVVKEGISATDGRIPGMTMQIASRDTDGNYSLIRNYFGGKVARMSLHASEGEELRVSADEIIFKDISTNITTNYKTGSGLSLGTDPGLTPAGRFMFAGATMIFFGTTLARIKRFSLSIDNQLEPKYYLSKATGDPTNLTQVLNDIVEGKRQYQMEVELDLVDPATDLVFFKFLLDQAAQSGAPTAGGLIKLDFAEGAGEGVGSLIVDCSLGSTTTNPGSVVTEGKASIGAPPAGYMGANYQINVDTVQITVPTT